MANTKLVRDGFRVPIPKPGDGTKILLHNDGTMTCSWDRPQPKMALDAAIGGPVGSPNYNSYNSYRATDDDPSDNPGGDDTEDRVRQLLEGKLSPEDLDALCALIFPDANTAPASAQDRKRRQARDQRPAMPSEAEIFRRIAVSGEVRAERVLKQHAALVARFPALRNARVA